mmetsp:Transcript_58715/g.137007  ORF Transcript_58715/g.137007 Transcript_58715/m.137007 type:complete len:254 (+) Transcript_58715:343-1104(+)
MQRRNMPTYIRSKVNAANFHSRKNVTVRPNTLALLMAFGLSASLAAILSIIWASFNSMMSDTRTMTKSSTHHGFLKKLQPKAIKCPTCSRTNALSNATATFLLRSMPACVRKWYRGFRMSVFSANTTKSVMTMSITTSSKTLPVTNRPSIAIAKLCRQIGWSSSKKWCNLSNIPATFWFVACSKAMIVAAASPRTLLLECSTLSRAGCGGSPSVNLLEAVRAQIGICCKATLNETAWAPTAHATTHAPNTPHT